MKKKFTYITPQMKVVAADTAKILAGSSDTGKKTIQVEGETDIQLSKGRSWYSDYSDNDY